jgi:cytochrome c peroxidase
MLASALSLGACGGGKPSAGPGGPGDAATFSDAPVGGSTDGRADPDADLDGTAFGGDAPADAGGIVPDDDASPEAGGTAPDGGASSDAGSTPPDGPFVWRLPAGFPAPVVPGDNPMSTAKVFLGRHLFYDNRLSLNQTQSCASCHKQELAFTDGRATALGSTGQAHPRSAMSLVNVAYASTLTWANPLLLDLEHQALVPIFGDDPVELGLTSAEEIEDRLKATDLYPTLFAAAWPDDPDPLTLQHLVQALASFERTIISRGSAYDRWLYGGDTSALSDSAKRGYAIFNSEDAECFHCHTGFDLTDHVNWSGKAFFDRPYHNTGLYNLGGTGAYPEPNTGLFHVTRNPTDMGRFKAPSLRNVAVTAPYMHDGSIATLEQVLDHYQAGGRTIPSGPNAGIGAANPFKDPVIQPLSLTAQQRDDLIEFLLGLTDDDLLRDPALSSPL